MEVCAVIAEYNPFHLGHLKHLSYVKETLGAKHIIVVMSGNFTQRGEPAILDKFTRARHAVLAGADAVIELPTVFSTANAEVFAKGAIKTIESLGFVDAICFGVESGKKEDYLKLARSLNNESKEFKKILKTKLDDGISLAKAKFETLKDLGEKFDSSLISSPNNILGVEYAKAVLKYCPQIEIFPMKRDGDHNDKTLKKGITSASSIRESILNNKLKPIKKCVPSFVYPDLKIVPPIFDALIMASLIKTSHKDLAKVPDCTEGLENRLKALAKDNTSLSELKNKAVTKRYTATRINRILINNLLGIDASLVKDALSDSLYLKVLAISKDNKDFLSRLSTCAKVPVLARKSDFIQLKKTAKACFDVDVLANDLYNLCTFDHLNENLTLFV